MISGLQPSPDKPRDEDIAGALAAIRNDVVRDGFAFRTGKEMRAIMRGRGLDAWPGFASSWDDLGLDVYMADGGRYRRRRFAAFSAADSVATLKPNQPHYQSRDHNPLNGGIERWFMPIADSVAGNGFARGMLGICTTLFDSVAKPELTVSSWHVEMHQFRIEASPCGTGMPTPEGPHRDGVDWVCVMLVNRTNDCRAASRRSLIPMVDRWVNSRLPIRSTPCFSMTAASFTASLRLRRSNRRANLVGMCSC